MGFSLKETIMIDGTMHVLEISGLVNSKITELKLDGRLFTETIGEHKIEKKQDSTPQAEVIKKPNDVWAKEAEDILRQVYPNTSAPDIVKSGVLPNRSEQAIYDRANFLGVQKAKPVFVSSSEKYCSKCGITKPLSEFNKSKKDKLGVQNTCRACQGKYFRERMRLKKSKRKLPEQKEKLKKDEKQWDFPENIPARELKEPPVKFVKESIGDKPNFPTKGTSLFLNWLAKRASEYFDINDFLNDHPSIPKEQAENIIIHQIGKKKLVQLSNTKFRVI